jgi:tetratricopeptide (TPR) repeat protein
MAKLYDRKKDYAKAIAAIACVRRSIDGPTSAHVAACTPIEADPSGEWTAQALEIESKALIGLGKQQEAEACIATLLKHPQTEMAGWLAAAKRYRTLAASDETMWETSQDAADRAMRLAIRQYPDLADVLRSENRNSEKNLPLPKHLPKTIASILYLKFGKQVVEPAWIERLLSDPEAQPLDLYTWAECYTEDRRPEIAWRLCARAVEIDPACFPARLALAENLAFDRRFSNALRVLEALAQEDPENVKVWITYARVLSWDKQYDAAIDIYDRIHAYNPMDPVPVRESARVAVWGKRMKEAMRRYRSLMEPSVDERLEHALKRLPSSPLLQGPAADRTEPVSSDAPCKGYQVYETFIERMEGDPKLSADEPLQRVRIDLLPEYRIQKWAYLESAAKWKAWNKHFLEAKDAYEELVAFDPGNAEALFDDAQVKCSLGLCDEETEPYEAILRMDPTHVQAKRGLERNDLRSRPKIGIDARTWSEKGRGDLSDIVVHRIQVLSEMPIRQDRYAVSAGMDSFFERPGSTDRTVEALGYTLHARGLLLPSLSGNLKWTHKVYQEADLGTSDFFDAAIRWKIRDWLDIDFGFERADEIANAFALQQQSRADHWKIGIHSQITRRLEAGLKAEAIDYVDDNSGKRVSGSIGYAFTDHPKIVKVILSETYRDTQQANRFFYQDDRLVDIVHPYWTPQSLTESTITLEWVHDLARELFCGAPENVYDLRLSFGTDTEDNAMVRLEGDWKLEIADHWLLVLRGLIHESRQWDASGVWAEVRYRF